MRDVATAPSPSPVVKVRDGRVFATSRDVAEVFGKNHRHVLDAIDNLLKTDPEMGPPTFRQTPYLEPQNGQTYRSFEMDRDGFTLLAMGFTGADALKWKRRYIAAFNAMEDQIRQEQATPVNLNDPAQLRALLLAYSEKHEALEKRVSELLPSEEALERIARADGSLCITDAAKALQMRPKDLFDWLRQNGWIYRRHGAAHDLGFHSKTSTGLLEHKVTTVLRADGSEKVTEQVRVTAKGLTKLAQLIRPPTRLI
ncbi:Rha family transcriptional regulator [Phreatobacter oligotrophus]|uniref:Rha family phage regulatory protein n=1 Tax=Phreatobacter oligotrophus TaxID=1122261 RepID=A0A2T4ZJ00_9HYPH|nr:phage regulatory protein/antirepressor Ant [Phreatobacter oligotrophus]PTM61924.1 Rha family phage regulatory protein [Phreatobacter oligotrophus]